MPSRRAKRCGVGTKCSVLLKRLHPKNIVAAAFPVQSATDRLGDLIVTHEGPLTKRGVTKHVVFFTSPTFPGEQLYVSRSLLKVTREGDPTKFFSNSPMQNRVRAQAPNQPRVEENAEDAGIELLTDV